MLDFLHRHTSRFSIMISVPLKHYLIEIQCHYTLMFEDKAILQTWKILSMLYIEEYREPWCFSQVGDRPEMLKGKSPDLFSFTVTGLNDIVNKHGGKSSQAQDAQTLISDFITKVTTSCRNIMGNKGFHFIPGNSVISCLSVYIFLCYWGYNMYVNILVYNIPINNWLNMKKEMHCDSQKQICMVLFLPIYFNCL